MNKAALEQLLAYLQWSWSQITSAIEAAPGDDFLRDAPGSGWPALRDCLGHIAFGYDRWMAVIRTAQMTGTNIKGLSTLAAVSDHRAARIADLQEFLTSYSDPELEEVREIPIDGAIARYSYGQLLTHALLHERGHHGDVSTLFYQLNIPIPRLDFRFSLPDA